MKTNLIKPRMVQGTEELAYSCIRCVKDEKSKSIKVTTLFNISSQGVLHELIHHLEDYAAHVGNESEMAVSTYFGAGIARTLHHHNIAIYARKISSDIQQTYTFIHVYNIFSELKKIE